ncbi:MAG: hypothetical protein AB1791_07540 [Chloroflexota bacterium]
MTKIPVMPTLDATVEFWETHDSSEFFDDMDEIEFEVALHKDLFHPDLIILTHRPTYCPRCRNELGDAVIEYGTLREGHLLIIRDVPALRCRSNGHFFLLEEVLDQIEHLFELEETHKLLPAEIIQLPVFSFKSALAVG